MIDIIKQSYRGLKTGLLVFVILASFICLYPHSLQAESRMPGIAKDKKAGTSAERRDNKDQDNKDIVAAPHPLKKKDVLAQQKAHENTANKTFPDKLYDPDYELIESYGVLHTADQGALGIDLWDDTDYRTLYALIKHLPDKTPYATLNSLARRALLTTADARLIQKRISPMAGKDLTTARLETLIRMGDYKNAAALYTANPDMPYSEKMARLGITALLGDRQMSLACLEAFSVGHNYINDPFWGDLFVFCNHNYRPHDELKATHDENQDAARVKSTRPQSKIIGNIIDSVYFRYAVNSLDRLNSLNNLDRLLLMNTGRFDFSTTTLKNPEDHSPDLLALLVQDKNLPQPIKFTILVHLINIGLKDTVDLADVYNDVDTAAFAKAADKPDSSATDTKALGGVDNLQEPDYKLLAHYYKKLAAGKADNAGAILKDVITLYNNDDGGDGNDDESGKTYTATAYSPFASSIRALDPQILLSESEPEYDMIRGAFRIMMTENEQIPEKWIKLWKTFSPKKPENMLLSLAISFHQDMPSILPDHDYLNKINNLDGNNKDIASLFYEKLDNNFQIIDYDTDRVYEKQFILTLDDEYVIPNINLMESLVTAVENRQTGDIVLLSTIALRDKPPKDIQNGLLNEVLNGFYIVGLTEESRALSKEIILGLIKKIKGE